MAEVGESDRVVVDARGSATSTSTSASEQRRASSARELGELLRRAQDLPVDLLHHVEGRVVDVVVVAERERLRHRHVGRRERRRAPCTRGPCRARSAARGRAAAGAAPTRGASSPTQYVRFERPPEISAARAAARRSRRRRSRRTTVRSRSRSTPGGVSVTRGRLRSTRCGRLERRAVRRAGRCRGGSGRPDRRACRRGSRRRRALPRTRRPRSRTRGARGPSRGSRRSAGAAAADGAGLRLADRAGLGTLARRREEQAALPVAGRFGGPRERTGEDQVGDRLGGHGTPPLRRVDRSSGGRWGEPAPSPSRYRLSEPDHKTICQRT